LSSLHLSSLPEILQAYGVLADLHFDGNFPMYCWSTQKNHECKGAVLLRGERAKMFIGNRGMEQWRG
jgi:hypothetical protein